MRRGGEFVRTAEIGDDGLAHGTIDALVLDDLNIGALAGLEAEEHGALGIEHQNLHSSAAINP